MRILFMTHFYPPASCGGAGYYTATLAEAFQQGGHETRVLCAGRWSEGEQHFGGYSENVYHGVPVRRFHLNWKLAPAPFDYLYDNPVLDNAIRSYLSEYRPDIAHIISCCTLSARVISTIREMDIAVVVHLVDYWFICPLHTLLRKEGHICFGGKDAWDCQRCMLHGTKPELWTRPVLPDSIRSHLFLSLGRIAAATRLPGLIGLLGNMAQRRSYTLQALCQADAIIAPSQALINLYVRNGVPRHRIRLIPHGIDVQWAKGVQRSPAPRLRIGFLGNILPIKGVHVLLDAFKLLETKDNLELHIHGNDLVDLAYTARLKASLPANVFWNGAYQKDQLASILSNIDVLVVPSIWHEVHGFVIQEGLAAGCPVIISDLGGMTETVINGVNGLHFRPGDSVHLAQQIERLVRSPNLLSHMRDNIPKVRTAAEELDDLGAIYNDLIKHNDSSRG
jgi:glycosyltransferase involved in cell wall biosynthesis